MSLAEREDMTEKDNKPKCEDCAGCTQWKCECYNERAYAIDEFAEMVIAELEKAKHEIKLNENDLDIYRGAMICAIEIVKDLKGNLKS